MECDNTYRSVQKVININKNAVVFTSFDMPLKELWRKTLATLCKLPFNSSDTPDRCLCRHNIPIRWMWVWLWQRHWEHWERIPCWRL